MLVTLTEHKWVILGERRGAGGARIGRAQTIRVDITPDHVRNTFRPTETFGAGVDRIPLAATDKIFTEPMIKQILSAGWQTKSPIDVNVSKARGTFVAQSVGDGLAVQR